MDFRLLFSFALAYLNHTLAKNGLSFKFTSIAGMASNELTHGFVRSYLSLNGRTAYTMVLDKSIARYCYGDMLSILARIGFRFLAVDGNVDALLSLVRTKVEMSDRTYNSMRRFLLNVTGFIQSKYGFEAAMLIVYFKVISASVYSGAGVALYNFRNAIIRAVLNWLANVKSAFIRNIVLKLLDYMDQNTADVITGDGVAPHGFVPFFKQIIR